MDMKHGKLEQPSSGAPPTPIVYVNEKVVWEFKHLVDELPGDGAATERRMNALGAAGWELAGVAAHRDTAHFWFKRLKSG